MESVSWIVAGAMTKSILSSIPYWVVSPTITILILFFSAILSSFSISFLDILVHSSIIIIELLYLSIKAFSSLFKSEIIELIETKLSSLLDTFFFKDSIWLIVLAEYIVFLEFKELFILLTKLSIADVLPTPPEHITFNIFLTLELSLS